MYSTYTIAFNVRTLADLKKLVKVKTIVFLWSPWPKHFDQTSKVRVTNRGFKFLPLLHKDSDFKSTGNFCPLKKKV